MADPREFMEGLRIDLYGGQVFVFTPKGDVVNLPAGRDPGRLRLRDPHRGRAPHDRREGGRQARPPRLRAADRRHGRDPDLEGAGRGPVQDWLQFVATPRARNKIRQWFSRERREDALEQGRDPCSGRCASRTSRSSAWRRTDALTQVADELKYPTSRRSTSRWGRATSRRSPSSPGLSRLVSGDPDEDVTEVPLARPGARRRRHLAGRRGPGASDVWVRLGRCCTPVPGDEIVGVRHAGPGRERSPHRLPEREGPANEPERLIEVAWAEGKPTTFVGRDPGRGARPHPAAVGRRHRAVRQPREHPVRDLVDRQGPDHEAAVHVRARRHHPPVARPRAVKKVESVYDAYRVVPRYRLMRVVLQRVSRAAVTIGGDVVAEIGRGSSCWSGVGRDDGEARPTGWRRRS